MEYFAKLSNYGRKKNSLLIEHGHKTIGSANPCLVVSGKGNYFEIKALNDVGKRFLQFIKKDFGFCDKTVYGRDKIYGTLTPSRKAVSEDQRLKAKTHMDIIRTVAFSFKPTNKPFMPYCGMFGIVSYDFIDNLEDLPSNEDEMNEPDYILYFLDNMFIVDHKLNRTYFVANAMITDNKKEKVYEQCNKTLKNYEELMSKKVLKPKKFKKKEFKKLLPELGAIMQIPKEDTKVEIFEGKEGLKYFLKDVIKTKKEVLITGLDDGRYHEALPDFMLQYFRDLKKHKIKERVIAMKKDHYSFDKKVAPNTQYRYLEEEQFNPTNTFIYGNKIVIVSWGTPVTAIMIKNSEIAKTYKNHFEHLWKIAKK